MSFRKDGEIKVWITDTKTASKESKIQYGVDDLVKDSDREGKKLSEETKNVSK